MERSWSRSVILTCAVVGALVLAAALLVPFPDPIQPARDAMDALGPWAYVLIAAVIFLETSVGLGMLSPGEAVIAVAGAAAADGALDPVVVVAICWCGGVAGDTISWSLGRRYGAGALGRLGPRVGVPAARVGMIADRVAAGGGWILVAGRFVGPVRVLAPFLTGASGMRYRTFLPYDVTGIALWAGTYLAIGWAFSGALESATGTAGQVGVAVLLATTAAVVLGRRLNPRPAAARR